MNESQLRKPLRAIVLDNDEATGYYILLFDIWRTLQETSLGQQLSIRQIIEFFVNNWDSYHLFRPDLFKFLKTCVELRDAGRIDAIIMYTHQNAEFTWSSSQELSVPAFLSMLMGHIVAKEIPLKQRLFDYVLTLPPVEYRKEGGEGGWILKTFDRILNLYPWKPRDIRGVIFVDDHATPKMIEADTIDASAKDIHSWYKVEPYRSEYGAGTYFACLEELIRTYRLHVTEEDSASIEAVGNRIVNVEATSDLDRTFVDLEAYVRERYPPSKSTPKTWKLW